MKRLTAKRALVAVFAAAMLALGVGFLGCTNDGGSQGGSDTPQTDPEPAADPTPAEPETRIITDAKGNQVEIPAVIDSIVVPFPAATQTVLGMGGVDQLTGGYILTSDMNKIMWADKMASYTLIRPSDLNVEIVLGCEPDFCILASQGQADVLADTGIPVLMYAANTIQELEKVADMVADALNTDEARTKAAFYTSFTDDLIAKVTARTANLTDDQKPVVYVITEDDPLCTHGKDGTVHDWVRMSGGIYVPELLDLEGGEITLTAEQVLTANPDIIICTTVAGRDALLSNEAFASLKAVQNGQVYLNPLGGSVWFKGHFENPLELTWAPMIIQPDLFGDWDTRAMVQDFYTNIYGYTITDSDWELIMNPPVGSR